MTAEELAKFFHDTYEKLAPEFGYETARSWSEIPEDHQNKRLIIAVCGKILERLEEEQRQ